MAIFKLNLLDATVDQTKQMVPAVVALYYINVIFERLIVVVREQRQIWNTDKAFIYNYLQIHLHYKLQTNKQHEVERGEDRAQQTE